MEEDSQDYIDKWLDVLKTENISITEAYPEEELRRDFPELFNMVRNDYAKI